MPKPPSKDGDEQPKLRRPLSEVDTLIATQIAKGQSLAQQPIASNDALKAAKRSYYTWDEYNAQLLRTLFTSSSIAREYVGSTLPSIITSYEPPLHDQVADFQEDVEIRVRRLASLKERLSLYEVDGQVAPEPSQAPSAGDAIFIVHGRDEAALATLARFLEHVTKRTPVILHEQANEGHTIIEKFEKHAGRARYAVILATADDEGRLRNTAELRPRARQNVVFEWGFFVAKLGRANVALLHPPGLEKPSDLDGLVYIQLDDGVWKQKLAKELIKAGIDTDLNGLVGL